MNRKLLAAVVSGTLAVSMAAQVQADEMEVQEHHHQETYEHEHEMEDGMMSPPHGHGYDAHPHAELHEHSFTLYGSLRYGVKMTDPGKSNNNSDLDIGNNFGSRFGINGSSKVSEGLTAGFKLERNLDEKLGERHHHVYLSGGSFGTVTLGRQASPYYGASTWDGANHLGGSTDVGSMVQGVGYASSPGGPFSFSVLAGHGMDKEGADNLEVHGHFNAGPVSLNAGYKQHDDETRIGGTVEGSAGSITLKVGYETATDLCIDGTKCGPMAQYDSDRFGFNLSYLLAAGPGGGKFFVQYANRDKDGTIGSTKGADTAILRPHNPNEPTSNPIMTTPGMITYMTGESSEDYWVFGYSYYASEAVTINIGHGIANTDKMPSMGRSSETSTTTSIVVLKVDF